LQKQQHPLSPLQQVRSEQVERRWWKRECPIGFVCVCVCVCVFCVFFTHQSLVLILVKLEREVLLPGTMSSECRLAGSWGLLSDFGATTAMSDLRSNQSTVA
jgi:hypothetical protein